MTKLSVNINKLATLRNARGHNNPDVLQWALDIERFGSQGITVHPRPDERHIRYADVRILKPQLTTEFNIEGYPDEKFIELVLETKPAQVTLVPDAPDAITSNAGWDTIKHRDWLMPIVAKFKKSNIRVSIFVDPDVEMVVGASQLIADRIELYTEPFASNYTKDKIEAIRPYKIAAQKAKELGLGINAGHDLDLQNLKFLVQEIPFIDEVSIGHALICDALIYGMHNTIQMYLRQLA